MTKKKEPAPPAVRPPNDRGQGRKGLAEGVESVHFGMRMTPEQKDKLQRLGGPAWVRDRVDRAKDPE